MFGKPKEPQIDPRIRKSRDALGDALVALIHEKAFDSITVSDVLERAGVARSTFYSHFSDKDDLFRADAIEFFDGMAGHLSRTADPSSRVFPARELFAHLLEMRDFLAALAASGKLHEILRLGQERFARGIELRLKELPRLRGVAKERAPWLGAAFAGALIALVTRWIEEGMPHEPSYMDDLFHRLVSEGAGARSA